MMKTLLRAVGLALILALALPAGSAFARCNSSQPYAKLVSGTSYGIGGVDNCGLIVLTSGSAVAVTLPAPGTAGDYQLGYTVKVFMEGGGSATITPQAAPVGGTTPTINGASSLSLATTKSATIYVGTDGNFYATYNGG